MKRILLTISYDGTNYNGWQCGNTGKSIESVLNNKISKLLNEDMSLKCNNLLYVAGQFSGVEGYVESAASGLFVGIEVYKRLKNITLEFPKFTMLGSLMNYIIKTSPDSFAPMNANFAIMYGVNKLNRLEKAEECVAKTKDFIKELDEQK